MSDKTTKTNIQYLQHILINGTKCHAFGGKVYLNNMTSDRITKSFLEKMVKHGCMIEFKCHHYELSMHGVDLVCEQYPKIKKNIDKILQLQAGASYGS